MIPPVRETHWLGKSVDHSIPGNGALRSEFSRLLPELVLNTRVLGAYCILEFSSKTANISPVLPRSIKELIFFSRVQAVEI